MREQTLDVPEEPAQVQVVQPEESAEEVGDSQIWELAVFMAVWAEILHAEEAAVVLAQVEVVELVGWDMKAAVYPG